MNKKAMALRTAVSLIVVIAIIIFSLLIVFGVTSSAASSTVDLFCKWNVEFTAFVAPDAEILTAFSPMASNFFCNTYKDLIELDEDKKDLIGFNKDKKCDNFINFGKDPGFDLYDCPMFDICDDEPYPDSCKENTLQKSPEIEERCSYRDRCKSGEGGWLRTYHTQQIVHMVERCLYMSDKSCETSVPCFDMIERVQWIGTITKHDLIAVGSYSKSFYNPQQIVDVRDFKHIKFAKIVHGERDDNVDQKLEPGIKYRIGWIEPHGITCDRGPDDKRIFFLYNFN